MPEATLAPRNGDVLAAAAPTLEAAGCDTARLDAELLLAEVLGVGRERLVLDADRVVDAPALERFHGLVERRAAREPVAYILGRQDFRRIVLRVDRTVLIPRPETELLVEVGLSLPRGARVADVGTGSGAVALALKDERPDLVLTGIDVDDGAVALARTNAARLGLEVEFVAADLLDGHPYDAVLANLPYVADGATLPPEVARYEPSRALYGGRDGLDPIRRLLQRLDRVPLVALEIGFDQGEAAASLVGDAGFGAVERVRDLAGHERVVVGRR